MMISNSDVPWWQLRRLSTVPVASNPLVDALANALCISCSNYLLEIVVRPGRRDGVGDRSGSLDG